MAKFVPDIKTKRWVVISPQRIGRPGADELGKRVKKKVCPFCPGNEKMTPPEVFRLGNGNSNGGKWLVRVVPNKYPITDVHEVIIHSPSHKKDIEDLSLKQIEKILQAYRYRYQIHATDGQVLIFCNHGKGAGASLGHPHSQLVVIPAQINLDVVTLEPLCNPVKETGNFFAYCPDFSQWPYEVWVAPKTGFGEGVAGEKFGEISDQKIKELGRLLQEILQKLIKILPGINYNYYIFPGEKWYLRIIPRLVDRAGFELGTGLSVNIKDPTEAARELKE